MDWYCHNLIKGVARGVGVGGLTGQLDFQEKIKKGTEGQLKKLTCCLKIMGKKLLKFIKMVREMHCKKCFNTSGGLSNI